MGVAALTSRHDCGNVANGTWLTSDLNWMQLSWRVLKLYFIYFLFRYKYSLFANVPFASLQLLHCHFFARLLTLTRRLSVVSPEKVHGVHQLSSPAGDEEWKIRAGLQTVPEDDPSGQSQACYPGQQLPSSQVWIQSAV